MFWRLLIACSVTLPTLFAMEKGRSEGSASPATQNVCATDTATWAPQARSLVVSILSDTDYSASQLPYRPSPSLVQVATDQATCDAAYAAEAATFGSSYSADSILVVKVDTVAYVVFSSPDTQKGLTAARFWTSAWQYLFILVGI